MTFVPSMCYRQEMNLKNKSINQYLTSSGNSIVHKLQITLVQDTPKLTSLMDFNLVKQLPAPTFKTRWNGVY